MLDAAKVTALLDRARREVDEGLLPAVQVAVGWQGEVVVDATFGAPDDARILGFSTTKALVGAAAWRLVGEGSLDLAAPVADYIPAFAANGKEAVTVEQVLLHLGGFPLAPLGPNRWSTRAGRHEQYARWHLTLPPGEVYVYHPTAGHWVIADIVEELTGLPYADAVERTVTAPLGLPRLLGIPVAAQAGVLTTVGVGSPATASEIEAEMGVPPPPGVPTDVAIADLLSLNDPRARATGVPGGGGIFRAADLALLYQAFLHDPQGLWDPAVLADATGVVRNRLPDTWGVPANRTRGGLVVKGDDGLGHRRGFGHTTSARAFGHDGVGGQMAFADPASGLSVAYLTSGLDQHLVREKRRGVDIASLAADVLAGDRSRT
ncbi:MAG TPA: serine hydrolase domain-containing protein [Acidimicrobiales bacterium]